MLPEYNELDLSLIARFRKALLSQQWDIVLQILPEHLYFTRIRFEQAEDSVLVFNSVLDYAIKQNQYEIIFQKLTKYRSKLAKPNLNTVISMLKNQQWFMLERLFEKGFLSSHYNYCGESLPVTELMKRLGHPEYTEPKEGIYWLYGEEVLREPHKPSSADIKPAPIGTGRPSM